MAEDSPLQLFNESSLLLPFTAIEAQHLLSILSKTEDSAFSFVEVVFVDETEIVQINSEFLSRDYVTDIISFRYDEDDSNQAIEGTLYCCAPRIVEQAKEFKESEKREFLRILIHGLLHLIGYDDQDTASKEEMSKLEDHYLSQLL